MKNKKAESVKHAQVTPRPFEQMISCRDCRCSEGSLHDFNCLQESCPFCGGQLASCDCVYDFLGLKDKSKYTDATAFLPPDIYSNGINEDQNALWFEACTKKGRFPYVRYPLFCAYCGEAWPDFFIVPDDEWKEVIEPAMRSKILCRECFDRIQAKVREARFGN